MDLGSAGYGGHHARHLTVRHCALDDRVNATASAAIQLAGAAHPASLRRADQEHT
jgi:hypothetical protein